MAKWKIVAVIVVLGSSQRCILASPLKLLGEIEHPNFEEASASGSIFGTGLSIQGDTLFVADRWDDQAGENAGAVFQFTLDGELVATFLNPDHADDSVTFGYSPLLVDGDRVFIAAPANSSSGLRAGVVYQFDATGQLLKTIYNPGDDPQRDNFGLRSAQVGDAIWIAAPAADTTRQFGGEIHVFDLSGDYQSTIKPPPEDLGELFGMQILPLTDDVVLVGMGNDDSDGDAAGGALLFDVRGNWIGRIGDPDPIPNGNFARFAMRTPPKDVLLIGRIQASATLDSWSERVYAFNEDHDFLFSLNDPNPAFENWFGRTMASLDDEFFVVASIFDDALGPDVGAVHLYDHFGRVVQTLEPPVSQPAGKFGSSVAVADNRIYVGQDGYRAPGAAKATGVVHIFELDFPPGDANWDGVVNLADFSILKGSFGVGTHFYEGDFDRDDDVDLADFAILKDSFGTVYGEHFSVPEPEAIWLLAICGLASLAIGRRKLQSRIPIRSSDQIQRLSLLLAVAALSIPVAAIAEGPIRLVRTIEHPNFEEASLTGSYFGVGGSVQGGSLFVVDNRDDQAGNDAGAVYQFNLDGELVATFLNPEQGDETIGFGSTLAVGERVFIGSRRSETDGTLSGVVYEFDASGILASTIRNPWPDPDWDGFGFRMAQAGDSLWISAPSADTTREFGGAIHVYDLEGRYQRTITPPEQDIGAAFGAQLLVLPDGNILVGMAFDDSDANNAGGALIYDPDGNWIGRISDPDPIPDGNFGRFAMKSLPKDVILIGRIQEGATPDSWSERAYAFNLDHDFLFSLDDPNPAFENWFGRTMDSLDDEFFLVSSLFDGHQGANVGAVHVYDHEGRHVETIRPPDPQQGGTFGSMLTVEGDRVFIGQSRYWVENAKARTGVVHIFDFTFPPGDANWDGVVNLADFSILKDSFGVGSHFYEGDFDRDDDVDIADFSILKDAFGTVYGDHFSVPEPEAIWLLAICGLASLRICRTNSRWRRRVKAFSGHVQHASLLAFFTAIGGSFSAATAGPLNFVRTIEHPRSDEAAGSGSLFGTGVKFEGESLLVRDTHDDHAGTNSGAVFRFDVEGELISSFYNPEFGDDTLGFGLDTYEVGQDLFIASWRSNIDDDGSGVLYRFGPDGRLLATIHNPGLEPYGDGFGKRVRLVEGDLWVAASSDDSFRQHSGAIHVFDLESAYQRTIFPPPQDFGTGFGSHMWVMADGNVAVSMSRDSLDVPFSGSVLVLNSSGELVHRIGDPDPVDRGNFGQIGSISSSGEVLLVGRIQDNSPDEWSERMYAFGQDYQLLLSLDDPNPSYKNWFGRSSGSLDDEFFFVTSIFDDALGLDAGAVHIYDHQGTHVQTISAPDSQPLGNFGSSVAISGGAVAIGQSGYRSDGAEYSTGVVHIYDFTFPPGDANWNGVVDLADFAILKDSFGQGSHFYDGDFDRDDDVDLADFVILKDSFGTDYGEHFSVPEPEALAMLAMAFGMVLPHLRQRVVAYGIRRYSRVRGK